MPQTPRWGDRTGPQTPQSMGACLRATGTVEARSTKHVMDWLAAWRTIAVCRVSTSVPCVLRQPLVILDASQELVKREGKQLRRVLFHIPCAGPWAWGHARDTGEWVCGIGACRCRERRVPSCTSITASPVSAASLSGAHRPSCTEAFSYQGAHTQTTCGGDHVTCRRWWSLPGHSRDAPCSDTRCDAQRRG